MNTSFGHLSHMRSFSFLSFKAVFGDYGWALKRDDLLSGAHLFLGTMTNYSYLSLYLSFKRLKQKDGNP